MRVAIGAARGLRYLHEDCRLGCIVHTDFRPRNIFLTHDFEAMVNLLLFIVMFSWVAECCESKLPQWLIYFVYVVR